MKNRNIMRTSNRILLSIFCLFFFKVSLAADWYRIMAEGNQDQMIALVKKYQETNAAVTNPRVVQYAGKTVLMVGPYSDQRINEIKQNFTNKNLDPNTLIFFQLTSQATQIYPTLSPSQPSDNNSQVKVAQSPPPVAPTPQVALQAAKTPIPPKKTGPVQLINTQNKIATIGSCYSVLSTIVTIDPNSVGTMANYISILNQAKAAKPSFENGKNPAPAGMPRDSWSIGWNYTGQIIGDASDADKLKAYNICMSAF